MERPPYRKVIKTLIYGVRSSGSLARACEVIMDNISGQSSYEKVLMTTDNLKLVLGHGGFTLKGFTFSGSEPPEDLTGSGDAVTVGGLKSFPKGDFISINCGNLIFQKNPGVEKWWQVSYPMT